MPTHVGRLTPPKNQRPVPVADLVSGGSRLANRLPLAATGGAAPTATLGPAVQADDATRRAVAIFGAQHGLSPASAATQLGLLMQEASAANPGGPSFLRVSPQIQFRFGGAGTGQAGSQITVDEGPFQANLDPGTLFSQGGSLSSTSVNGSRKGPFLSPLLDPSGDPAVAPFGLVPGATDPPLITGTAGPEGIPTLGRSLSGESPLFADGKRSGGTTPGRSLPGGGTQSRALSGGGADSTGTSLVPALPQSIDPAGVATALNGTAVAGATVGGPSTALTRTLPSTTTSRSLGAPTVPSGPSISALGGARLDEQVQTLNTVNKTNPREGTRIDTGNGNFGVVTFSLRGQRTQSGLGANTKRNHDTRATNAFFGLDPETGEKPPAVAETELKEAFDIQAADEATATDTENAFITSAMKFLKTVGDLPAPQFNFGANPAVSALQQSILDSIRNPQVLDEETIAKLKSQSRERIQAGQRGARQQIRQDLASRGILDSGASIAAARAGAETSGRDIARAERDIDVESALLNADRLAQAQQLGLGLTGQLGSFGLGGAQLALGGRAQDIGLAGGLAGLEAGRPVFVRDTLSEALLFDSIRRTEERIGRELTAEERQQTANFIAAGAEALIPLFLGD